MERGIPVLQDQRLLRRALLLLPGLALCGSLMVAAESEKLVQDSMKRFSIRIPASWTVGENSDGNTVTLLGEDSMMVITTLFRGTNLEQLHHQVALQFAYRVLDGPPKKPKVRIEKRRVGNWKAIETDYDVKGGPDDKYSKFRVHIISIDGEKHKFTIVVTLPLELVDKNGLGERIMKMIDSFAEME
jgi:hypothetical protein